METARPHSQPSSESSVADSALPEMKEGNQTSSSVLPETESSTASLLLRRLPSRVLDATVDEITKTSTLSKQRSRRQPSYTTLRFTPGEEVDVNEISLELVQDKKTDDAINQEIRNLTASLEMKKRIKALAEKKRPDEFTFAQSKRSVESISDVRGVLQLWSSHLKYIKGHFGSSVAMYFYFIRALVFLNIPVFCLLFAFVILPQILFRWFQQEPPGYHQNVSFTGQELLTGLGFYEQTELYYGYYTNLKINVTGVPYDMKYAYVCASAGYYVLVLIILIYMLSASYKRSYVQTSDFFKISLASKVFSAWDFGIMSSEAADLKQNSIGTEIKECLPTKNGSKPPPTPGQLAVIWIKRIAINIIVLATIAGSTYLIWYLTSTDSLKNDIGMLSQLAMPLCVSALNFVIPILFASVVRFECYKRPNTEFYLTVFRTVLLSLAMLAILVSSWFEKPNSLCWETYVGAQLYSLVIIDFLFIVVATLLIEFVSRVIRHIINLYRSGPKLGKPQFNVGQNTLNVIFSQILVWLGAYYSPLISFIMIIKLVVIFYIKRLSVAHNCRPPEKMWRAGQAPTVLYVIMFVSYLLSIAAFIYSIVAMKPSKSCGPFQNYNHSYEVFHAWTEAIHGSEVHGIVRFVFDFFTSAAFLAFVTILLLVIAYYTHVVAVGHYEIAELLMKQLDLEKEDKNYLTSKIKEMSTKISDLPKSDAGTEATKIDASSSAEHATGGFISNDVSSNNDDDQRIVSHAEAKNEAFEEGPQSLRIPFQWAPHGWHSSTP